MAAALLASGRAAAANTYYVATTGSDSNAGTKAAPFASWAGRRARRRAGDTVYFRGGRYKYNDATWTCGGSTTATVNAIVLSKSGTSGNPINYFAYPGEKPVFDFSGISDKSKYNCRQAGVRVEASWLHLKGLEFTGHAAAQQPQPRVVVRVRDRRQQQHLRAARCPSQHGPRLFPSEGGQQPLPQLRLARERGPR